MQDLRAGAAKVCITPAQDMLPAYNTAFHLEYHYVQDDIYVRTLVLESGGRRALFVVLDINDMGRSEDMKNAVSAACGIERDLIFCTATHTHETPAIDDTHYKEPKKAGAVERVIQYGDYVIEKTVECTRQAIAALRDAAVGYGEGKSYINVNRNYYYEDGICRDGPNFAGPSDKTVAIMKVTDLEGRIIAVLSNYAVHGCLCFMHNGVGRDDVAISGDLPGMTAAYIEERYQQDGTICLWTSGAAGDQVAIAQYLDASWNHDGTPGKPRELGSAIWAICRGLAEVHALDIIRVIKKTFAAERELKFFADERTVTTAAQKEVGSVNRLEEIEIIENGTVDIKLKVLTAGDMAFLGINGEISCPIGQHLKEMSMYAHTFVIPHNAERVEYLPTKEEYDNRSSRFYATIVKDGITEQLILPEFREMLEASLH